MRVCVRARACVCVCACVRACVCVCVYIFRAVFKGGGHSPPCVILPPYISDIFKKKT